MAQQTEKGKDTESTQKISHQVSKQINLPFYDDNRSTKSADVRSSGPVTTAVESYVRIARLRCSRMVNAVQRFNSAVTTKYNTAKAHSLGVIDFFRSEPELWQRCGIVAAAGLTGIISGYRRTSMVKARNMLLASGVAGVICWPQQTVETVVHGYNYVKEPVVNLWTEYSPGSPYQPKTTAVVPPSKYYSNKNPAAEDPGQSKAEDKDMYSTRGS